MRFVSGPVGDGDFQVQCLDNSDTGFVLASLRMCVNDYRWNAGLEKYGVPGAIAQAYAAPDMRAGLIAAARHLLRNVFRLSTCDVELTTGTAPREDFSLRL